LAVGTPTNNDTPSKTQNRIIKKLKTMTQKQTLHRQVAEQITEFEKKMKELHLLRRVSKDLQNYRKMIKLKKYD
jgi:DNA gyrase/topoisomerase IV subunit A